jgi:hypothetical protein
LVFRKNLLPVSNDEGCGVRFLARHEGKVRGENSAESELQKVLSRVCASHKSKKINVKHLAVCEAVAFVLPH